MKRILIKTEEEYNKLLEYSQKFKEIAFDTENSGDALNPKFALKVGFSVSFDGEIGFYIPTNHKDIKLDVLLNELFDNKEIIIMHNAVYDLGILQHCYNINLKGKKIFDTMIAQHLIDESNPKGLKKLTKRYYNISQREFNFDSPLEIYNAKVVSDYACDDAIFTFKHYLRLKEKLEEEGLTNFYWNNEYPFIFVLLHLRNNGFSFNIEKAKKIEKVLLKEKEELLKEIMKVTPQIKTTINLKGEKVMNINIDSDKDMITLLYDKLNLPVNVKTPKGAPAVNKEALLSLKEEHKIIPLLLQYSKIQKLLSSYTHSLYNKVKEDGKLYGDFLPTGTVTGRLSSANPNMQQLPRNDEYNIREFFIASEGYEMLVIDYSQQELRVCGHLTNSETFKDIYSKGKDLHLTVANDCFKLNIPEECLFEDNPEFETYTKKFKKDRTNAKSINFGLLYGRTAHGLQTQLGGSVEDCQKIVDTYFETYPEILNAIKKAEKSIKEKGFVRNLLGRKRRFSKVKGKNYYGKNALRQGFNFQIQGSCADMLRVVMAKLLKYIETTNDEVRMISTVHDEVIFEVKNNERKEEHKNKILTIMENTIRLSIPLNCSYDWGDNYADAK